MTLIELPDLVQGTDIARFWKLTHRRFPGQCWEWQSSKNRSGYGKFWLNGRTDLAHRVSYRIHHGPIPAGVSRSAIQFILNGRNWSGIGGVA